MLMRNIETILNSELKCVCGSFNVLKCFTESVCIPLVWSNAPRVKG